MTIASGSLSRLRYVEELVQGQTPTTGFRELPMVQPDFNFQISTERSKQVRPDRGVADVVRTDASAGGGFGIEQQYGQYDELMSAVLGSNWTAFGSNTAGQKGQSAAGSAGNWTAGAFTAGSATSGLDAFTTFKRGQWIRVGVSSTANAGKWLRVSKTVAPTSTVLTFEAGQGITTGADTGVKFQGRRLTSGAVSRSFSFEVQYIAEDGVTAFLSNIYRGMLPSKYSISFATGSIATGKFEFLGQKAELLTSPVMVDGQTTPAPVRDSFDAVNSVPLAAVTENGSPLPTDVFIQKIDLEIDASLRGQKAVGVLGNAKVALGTLKVMGTLEVYLADASMYQRMVNGTASDLSFRVADGNGNGNGYVYTLPKIKFTDATITNGGMDSDATVSLKYEALMTTVDGVPTMIVIDSAGVPQ